MEQIIIIGLLIIIVLILLDKKFPTSVPGKDIAQAKTKLPAVMGETKQKEGQTLPTDANERQHESHGLPVDNFDSETREEISDNAALKKNIDDILNKDDDREQEEEDWKYQNSNIESGFATGVTFQELSTAGQLLQEDGLGPDLEKQAVTIIQKIEGTELFDLLENSLGDASKRIAEMINHSTSSNDQIISSKRNNPAESFDIGEFV